MTCLQNIELHYPDDFKSLLFKIFPTKGCLTGGWGVYALPMMPVNIPARNEIQIISNFDIAAQVANAAAAALPAISL